MLTVHPISKRSNDNNKTLNKSFLFFVDYSRETTPIQTINFLFHFSLGFVRDPSAISFFSINHGSFAGWCRTAFFDSQHSTLLRVSARNSRSILRQLRSTRKRPSDGPNKDEKSLPGTVDIRRVCERRCEKRVRRGSIWADVLLITLTRCRRIPEACSWSRESYLASGTTSFDYCETLIRGSFRERFGVCLFEVSNRV